MKSTGCMIDEHAVMRKEVKAAVQFASKRIESLFDMHISGLIYFFTV